MAVAVFAAVLTLLAGGCAGPPRRPDVKRAIQIEFTVERKPKPSVLVELSFAGAPTGETVLSLHERALGQKTNAAFFGLEVVGDKGQKLPIGRAAAYRLSVAHAPGEALTVRYRIVPGVAGPLTIERFVRPVVDAQRFYLAGESGLLLPAHLLDGELDVRERWRGLDGWHAVSSFGAFGEGEGTTHVPAEALRHAVFVAGALRQSELAVDGGKLALATFGAWKFTDQTVLELVKQIVDGQRAYTQHPARPYFLITLLPVDAKAKSQTRPSIAGQSQTNAIALFAEPGVDVSNETDFRRLRRLLALHVFRQWSGPSPDADLVTVAIAEGFTSMLARRLLYRAGLFSVEEYTADLNASLQHYFLNPWRDLPDANADETITTRDEYVRAVQARGELLALLVDVEMRRRSEGRQSLDDVMRDLVVESKQSGQAFSIGLLAGRLSELVGSSFAQQLRAIAANQGMTQLPRDVLFPCLRQSVLLRGPFSLGFDYEASEAQKKIVGVAQGGPAWSAGLRDGMGMLGARIDFDNAGEEVRIQIRDGNATTEVRYVPQGAPRSVPQLTVNDARRCDVL